MLCRVRALISPSSAAVRRKIGILALAVLAVGGCSSASSGSVAGEPARQISTAPVPHLSQRDAPLKVSINKVSGNVPKSARSRLKASASRPVRQWLEAGVVKGPYPRAEAAQSAKHDRALLTNAQLGPRLVDVAAKSRSAQLSVLAVKGHPRGVTARVRLILLGVHPDGTRVTVRLAGDIYLTRTPAGDWQIFGYDLTREAGSG